MNTALVYAPNIRVDVPGFGAQFVPNGISRLGVDIDIREMTTGLDVEYRVYAPGAAHYPDVTLIVPAARRIDAQAWFAAAAKGSNIRKDITVSLVNPSTSLPVMRLTLMETFPFAYEAENGALSLKIGYITVNELRTIGSDDSTFDDVRLPLPTSHMVKVTAGSDMAVSEPVSVFGGSTTIELTETTIGGDKFPTSSPGHKTVTSLEMRLKSPGENIDGWIADVLGGKQFKKTVEVSLLTAEHSPSDPPTRIFYDCFPTRVTFLNPTLLLPNGNAPLAVDISIKPIRVELK